MPVNTSDGPSNVRINPDPDSFPDLHLQVRVGQIITCSARGNPEPDYSWHDLDDHISYNGSSLLIRRNMVRHTRNTI